MRKTIVILVLFSMAVFNVALAADETTSGNELTKLEAALQEAGMLDVFYAALAAKRMTSPEAISGSNIKGTPGNTGWCSPAEYELEYVDSPPSFTGHRLARYMDDVCGTNTTSGGGTLIRTTLSSPFPNVHECFGRLGCVELP